MITKPLTNSLEVNLAARTERQRKLFRSYSFISLAARSAGQVFHGIESKIRAIGPRYQRFSPLIHWGEHRQKVATAIVNPRTIYQRIAALSVGLFLMTGFMGTGIEQGYAEAGAMNSANLAYVVDQEGYFTNVSPQTFDGARIVKGKMNHTIEEGENLSLIASKYGIKVETLLWENSLSLGSTLKIGQKLSVPPLDGVSHTAIAGENLEKIAALYKADKASLVAYNDMSSGVIQKGQVIFIPNAKPVSGRSVQSTQSVSRGSQARAGVSVGRLAGTDARPTAGKFLIFPTIGSLTQKFHKGHFAFDIGNRGRPPIWAASAGTVIKASSGTWGGGYGTHIIIDHGNGVQTLYAHMEYLTVKVGEKVTQGQVVGKMGNTGNVRGVTGIHLHFEVIDRGIKRVPSMYY
ncbi:MAG: M23 family metallopeptidase [Patescibacteria group bacterium]